MTKQTYYLYAMMLLLATILTLFSCSKDSDLFYQAILPETGTIDQYPNNQEDTEDSTENTEDSADEGGDSTSEEEDSSDEGEDSTDEGQNPTDEEGDSTGDDENPADNGQMGSIVFDTDFETVQWDKNGQFANGQWDLHGKAEVRIVSDARQGKKAIWLGSFNNDKNRNEIRARRLLNWEETWIGWSMKVVNPLDAPRSYLQFRNMRASGGVGDGVINPLTISQGYKGNELLIKTSTKEQYVNTVWETSAVAGTQSHKADYNVGEWVDFVVHWKLDPVDGFIQVWVNGTLVVNETGTTTYRYAHVDGEPYDGDITNTLGPYWFASQPHGDVYYDAFKVWQGSGGTYEDVSPLGLSPNN